MADAHSNSPNSVYKYYDPYDILIYVGITRTGTLRNQQHNADKVWWPFVAKQDVEHFDSREAAHKREIELIRTLRPPFNKQHNHEHDELKSAYVALIQSGRLDLSARKLIGFYGKPKLKLTPHVGDSGHLSLYTQLSDSAVAATLTHADDKAAPRVLVVGHPRVLGVIISIKHDGRAAKIRTSVRWPPEAIIREAFAKLRVVSLKTPIVVHVAHVEIVLA